MTFTQRLSDELSQRGVPRRLRHRIVAELDDHLLSDPSSEARLGDPAALATEFADELGADAARAGARESFAALVLAAAALVGSQVETKTARGAAGPEVVLIVVGAQAALVAGLLSVLRAWRRRSATRLPAAEVALMRRRVTVALGGGLATTLGLLLYASDLVTTLLSAVATAALIAAAVRTARSGAVRVSTPGPAGDVLDDVPLLGVVRGLPVGPIACAAAALAVLGAGWLAEASLIEGLERGAFEGLAAAAGYFALGRAIGARPPRQA